MSCSSCKSTETLKAEFERARSGVDPVTVSRVMKGLPVDDAWSPPIRTLRASWSAYHTRLRV